MKTLILSGILLCFLVACNNSQNSVTSSGTSTEVSDDGPDIWNDIDRKATWFKEGSRTYTSLDSIDRGFMEFYLKFISDHNYQLEHIQFPILAAVSECDSTILLNSSNWKDYNYDFRKDFYTAGDSNILVQTDSRIYYESYREEVGFLFGIGFEKRNGQWYLTLYNVNVC